MKYKILTIAALFFALTITSQAQESTSKHVDATVGFLGGNFSVAASGNYNWHLGAKKKFEIGTGLRLTQFIGGENDYQTAPASITSKGEEGIHNLKFENTSVTSISALINLGYNFSEKFKAGFNIDVVGVSFGGEKDAVYLGDAGTTTPTITKAKPSSFNLLLVGDNDLGSLNSEFYARYLVTEKIGIKAGFQYQFTEYTTTTEVQELPELNDRFRLKAGMVMVGVSFKL